MQFRVCIGAALIAVACSACETCDQRGFPPDGPPADAALPGTMSLAWSVTDTSGQPITCDQVSASFVFLQLKNRGKVSGEVVSFACANSPATSQALDPGVYDVSFELHGLNLSLVTAPDQSGVVVTSGQNTQLSPIAFAIDARGGLVLSLVSPPATSNCKPPVMMGAGITGTAITLVGSPRGCVPVTFMRARGATMLGTYIVNCSSPAFAPCIERDETLTVDGLPSGPYTIHVRGRVGSVECWHNDDALIVPPQSKTLMETLNLALQTSMPGC